MVAAVPVVLLGEVGGLWRLPAARGRAVALRVEPPGYRHLAPDGLPSLTQHGRAGDAGGHWAAARSRVRGQRASSSVMLRMTDARLAIGPARRSLRCAPLGARASRTPPRSPPRPQPGRLMPSVLGPARRARRRSLESCTRIEVTLRPSPTFKSCAALKKCEQQRHPSAGLGRTNVKRPATPSCTAWGAAGSRRTSCDRARHRAIR